MLDGPTHDILDGLAPLGHVIDADSGESLPDLFDLPRGDAVLSRCVAGLWRRGLDGLVTEK